MLYLVLALACLLAVLQVAVRRHIRQSATTFITSGNENLNSFERWTLAAIAPQLMPLGLPVDSFRAPEARRAPALTAVLHRDWKISDRESLLRTTAHLEQVGYRSRCAAATGQDADDFLAWDFLRLVWLLWIAWNLDWISHVEMQDGIVAAAGRLQSRFPDWQSAAASYEAGLDIWAREAKVRKLIARTRLTIESLLTQAASPWQTTAWHTAIAGTIAE